MKISKLFWPVLITFCLFSSTSWAGQYIVGLGGGVVPDYEGSEDYTAVPMLVFKGNYDSGRYFSLVGTNFKLNVVPDKTYSFGPVLNYRMGRDDVDNKKVDSMDEIDGAFEVGAFGGIDMNNFLLGLELLADVSNETDGVTVKASAGYRWKATPELTITPTIFTTYADEDYMQSYFGVNSGNVGGSGLKSFDADSGFKDAGINLVVNYNAWQHWGIMGVLSYSALLNDAKHSPLVDDEGNDKQFFAGLMVTYRWGGK